MNIDRASLRRMVDGVKNAGLPGRPTSAVVQLWRGMNCPIFYTDRDIQCGRTPMISLGKRSWEVWEKDPSKLSDFIIAVAQSRMHLRVQVGERLSYGGDRIAAVALLHVVSGNDSAVSTYRGDACSEALEDARFEALFNALILMLDRRIDSYV